MTARLQATSLHVDRGGAPAIVDVTAGFPRGSWTGLVGANGSGKTSLLRALAGRLPISRGEIGIDGIDVSLDRAARARRIGFAPEAVFLPDSLTPGQLFQLQDRSERGGRDAALEDLWQALTLDRFARSPIGSLSAGTRQRVAIYSAFIGHLDGIVILDEPFNWLDPLTAYDTKAALRDLVDRGLTLITALHDFGTLTLYCQRGLLLADGRLSLDLDEAALAAGRADPADFDRRIVEHLRPAKQLGG